MTLSDLIERYLRSMVEESDNPTIEIVRSNLAEHFSCVPSQINYVLTTRFTPERGYLVESRRGGGGHVRITRLLLADNKQHWANEILKALPEEIDAAAAKHICDRLADEKIITLRERAIMQAALVKGIDGPQALRDRLRALILRSMILAILGSESKN